MYYGLFSNLLLTRSSLLFVSHSYLDMDYTIAQYKQPAFDKLAFDGAKEKLVKKLGYPKELLDVEYDHTVRTYIICNLLIQHTLVVNSFASMLTQILFSISVP